MKKQYTRIGRKRIAYKGAMSGRMRMVIESLLSMGVISGTINNKGWWIKAKYSV